MDIRRDSRYLLPLILTAYVSGADVPNSKDPPGMKRYAASDIIGYRPPGFDEFLLPLGPRALRGIVKALAPLEYDRIYSAWWDKVVPAGAKEAVNRSADRYLEQLTSG